MQSCELKSSYSTVHADVESLHIENQMNANNNYVWNPNFDEIWLSELEEIDMLGDITQILSAVRLGLLEDYFRRQRSDLRLRGGGSNRDDTEDDVLSTAASESQLSALLKKIGAIERKVRMLLKKTSHQSESAAENPSAPRQTDALYEKIEAYKTKLAKCEEKKKRLERNMRKSEKSVESMTNSWKLLKELASSNVGNTHRSAHKLAKVNFSLEANAVSDIQAIVVRNIGNNSSGNTFELKSSYGATIGEDRMCQKMYQARFKNFSLKNMGFFYNRFRTYEYYKSGVLDYIETRISDTETRLDVRLNFTMGKYHYNAAEVRFKRMENFLRSHMIYYSFRTGQQLVDRIVDETWKMWFPKRFYMPYDYFVDNSTKRNIPKMGGIGADVFLKFFNPRDQRYPDRWYASHIFRPICIPIPPGATKEIQLPSYNIMNWGPNSFHTIEFVHMLARYCFGVTDIFKRTNIDRDRKFDNYWKDIIVQGRLHAAYFDMIPRSMVIGEYFRTGKTGGYSVVGKDAFRRPQTWTSDLVQGFNVKKLDEIKTRDPEFKERYERWGKIHRRWSNVQKLRSDRTPYY